MKIFFVGLAQCPYASRACDIRLDSFAELFVKCGHDVTILNRYSPKSNSDDEIRERSYEIKELIRQGRRGTVGKILFMCSIIKEFCYLVKYRMQHGNDVFLHIYSGHYLDMLFYWIIAKMCGFKIVYQYVEYRLDEKRANPYHRLNAWLVDKRGAKLWDGVIPISHFLKDRALEVNPKIRYMIGPPICDFARFDQYRCEKENTVLYCGSAGYFEVIKLVVDAFNLSNLKHDFTLELIVAGKEKEIAEVRNYASQARVRTKLPYDELIKSYNRSKILMIPLRNNIKDISRFPNKVCEYAASKSTIVTTCYGEPAHFFKDKESAIISSDYTIKAISNSLDWLANNQDRIEQIGNNGYEVGLNSFDLSAYTERAFHFINAIRNVKSSNH